MSYNIIVPPPKIVDREIVKPALCGPGPCDVWPSVAASYSKPIITPMCDEFYDVLDDIRAGLRYLFQTKSKMVLAMSGAGHSGMEAVITNLVGPGDTLLIAARGMWDERAFIIAKRFGINVEVTRVPLWETFKLEDLEVELRRVKPTALFITHGDSSTGTVQKIQGLGDLCHKFGALLIVDTVVSLGGVPFLMDEWGVDAVYTSSQKSLSGPAGISPVALSARAEDRINNRKHVPSYYMDLKLLALQWNCYGNTRTYHHTLSPPMMWALRASLQEIIKESIEKSWDRHARTLAHLTKRLRELGFEFFVPNPEDRLPVVTTIKLPKGYDYLEFVKYMRDNHKVLVFGGIGPTVGMMLRVGTMGINSTIEMADKIADAMAETRRALKKSSL